MVSDKKLNILYNSLFYQDELSLEDIKSLGFDDSELNYMLNTKILLETNNGFYKIITTRGLYLFSMQLISKKQFDKAEWFLEKTLELAPDDPKILLQIFLRNIDKKNYDKAFKCLEKMFENETNYFKDDCNLYLFLLNMITDVPEKFKLLSKNINYNYFKVKNVDNNHILNEIRFLISNQKFNLALKKHQLYVSNKDKKNGQDVLLDKLLYQAKMKQIETHLEVLKLVQNKEYDKVVDLLSNIQKRHQLLKSLYYILKLVKDLLTIKNNKQILESQGITTNQFFKAIESRDYEYALSLLDNAKIYDKNKECFKIILNDIIKEINSIKEDEIKTDSLEENIDKEILVIINKLRDDNIKEALVKIKELLKKYEKLEYEFLVDYLLKISLLENNNYTLIIDTLSSIKNGTFTFNLSNYLQSFYEKIVLNHYEEASLYLDIINNINKLGFDCIFKNSLKQVLEDSRQEYELISYQANLKKLIDKKLEEATDYGVSLINPTSNQNKNDIYKLLEKNNGFKIFEIENQIILKFNPYNYEPIDIKEMLHLGKQAFDNEEYEKSIKYYRKVLESGKELSLVYSKIGLAYLKCEKYEVSANYLTVATSLSKDENTGYDYTNLIEKLKSTRNVENTYLKKPLDDNLEKYQVDNLDEILALEENGNNILDVFETLNLDNDKRVVVLIELAKKYYQLGIDVKAESFMKKIEKIHNKSKYVKYLYEDIKRNKTLYKKRNIR